MHEKFSSFHFYASLYVVTIFLDWILHTLYIIDPCLVLLSKVWQLLPQERRRIIWLVGWLDCQQD